MVFSSNVFLFLFLPLFLAVYYLTPNRGRARNLVVLIGSYAFYAWWRVDFLLLFATVTVWNYLIGLAIARQPRRSIAARRRLDRRRDRQPADARLFQIRELRRLQPQRGARRGRRRAGRHGCT